MSIWAISPLGVVFKACILCFSFFPPSNYVALWDSKTPHRPAGERGSWCLETYPPSRLPPQYRSLSLTLLSLFLFFIFCPTSFRREWAAFLGACCPPPYLLSKNTGCLSGCLVSSAYFQKLFCWSYSAFKWCFDEYVEEKVVSLSYSSPS